MAQLMLPFFKALKNEESTSFVTRKYACNQPFMVIQYD